MIVTRNRYAHDLLDALGATHNDQNAWALISWMQAEGGNALWNPLNTTRDAPGAWDYNWVHVKNYPTYETGIAATVATLRQQNFITIKNRLISGARARRTLRAVENSDWGTGGLALAVLPFVKSDYWKYANYEVAGSS